MDQPKLPQKWSEWKLIEKIGEGAYGAVYKAERVAGTDLVYSAIKIIQIPREDTELNEMLRVLGKDASVREYYRDMVDGYIREIQTMDQLKGITNIVTIQDYEVEPIPEKIGWMIYIRMELLTSFSQYLLTHKLGEADIIQMGADICSALEYCEKVSIVHRDIKPDNIFVSKLGSYKLGDFGVARKMDQSLSVYSSKGTYSYMAPEVYKGERYDRRADIYSLGLVLYRLLNRNREPFLPTDQQMVYYKDREEALKKRMDGQTLPPPVNASKPLAEVILKATAYQPDQRYATAKDLKAALLSIGSEPQPGKPEADREAKPRRIVFVTALFAICLLAGLLLNALYHRKDKGAAEIMALVKESETMRETEPEVQQSKAETETETAEAASQTEIEIETVEATIQAETETPEIVAQTETDEAMSQTETESDTEQMTEEVMTETTGQDTKGQAVLTDLDVTGLAGFRISASGHSVTWYSKNKFLLQLAEATGRPAEDEAFVPLVDHFSSQFSFNVDEKTMKKGDVVTMTFAPSNEYRAWMDEAGINIRYAGKSEAFQG